MLLFAIVFCLAGWWFVSIKNHGQNVTLFGMTALYVKYFITAKCKIFRSKKYEYNLNYNLPMLYE